MKIFGKKTGFTLSEVMITITLIGILASMTLPTIGSSVQQRARLAEFRTTYAKLDAALRNIVLTKGSTYACYAIPTDNEINEFGLNIVSGTVTKTGQCNKFKEDFMRALGAVRTCETNPITEGCIPNNYPLANTPDEGSEGSELSCFSNYTSSHAYVLDNSMIVFTNDGNNFGKFAVDVNGRKGPNRWGQDIFPFSIKATESAKINNNIYVRQIGIMPGDDNCTYGSGNISKTTTQMMKESAGKH